MAEPTDSTAHDHGDEPARRGPPPDTAQGWDDWYADQEQVWSGQVNGALRTEVEDLAPGRALDVGCGEGADALWLAARGWTVTATDISQNALDRGAVAAETAGLTIEWRCADVVTDPPAGTYDLVSVQYPALRHTPDDDAIRALLGAVAPGGRLLVVGHAHIDPEHVRAMGIDLADYVQPPDVARRLDDGWQVEVSEIRPRVDPPHGGSPHVEDEVLLVRRTSSAPADGQRSATPGHPPSGP